MRTRIRLSYPWTVSDNGVPAPILAVLLGGLFCSLVACTPEPVNDQSKSPTNAVRSVAEASEQAFVPFDVRPLLAPARKYFGAALDGAPASLDPVKDFATKVGKQPNILLYYLTLATSRGPDVA